MQYELRRSVLRFVPALVLLALCIASALVPRAWLKPLDLVGYAVCHRIPERSFVINNTQLPVCARDTGMFGVALLGLAFLAAVLPTRANQPPRRAITAVFVLFFLAWGFDGFNSYVALLRGTPLLYPPQNWLRLLTGAGMGMALTIYIVPLFNQAAWQPQAPASVLHTWRGVVQLVAVALAYVALVLWQPPFLYGPIALISALGVLMLLTIVNGLLFALAIKRAGKMTRWRELLMPMSVGLALTIVEIGVIDWLRATFVQAYGLPF
jgi:uncharacterized membrane protein